MLDSQITLPKRSIKTLRVAFITTTVSGVGYYRMANFAWAMRSWPGVETVVWPYSKNVTEQNPWQVDMIDMPLISQRIDYLCDKADVVVWQMMDFDHSYDFWCEMRQRHQKPFLMEIDDYLPDIPQDNPGSQQMYAGSRRLRIALEQMRQSDAVIVSTPYLKEQYKEYNANIFVMPNSINFKEWDKAHRRKGSDRIRIGWIGGGTHFSDLEMVRPVIGKVIADNPNVWFYCIHGVPNSFKGMKNVYWTYKWSKINLYPKFMASFKFDIGIAPLVDNNFNRGKSNLRWLEYSALKIPTIASNLPDFSRVISDGNGYIAETPEQWYDALTLLIRDKMRREQVGRNAYELVKRDFNVRKTATQYMRLLKGIVNGELLSTNEV